MAQERSRTPDQPLVYFDRIVLCRYRSRPDLFVVKEDDMGGELSVSRSDSEEGDEVVPWFQVRFGFRELVDGRICVAAFAPDIAKLPAAEVSAWYADRIALPSFPDSDPAFQRWSQRYLLGSWSSEDGPIHNLELELRLVQAITRAAIFEPLFRAAHNPALRYPVAENSEAFTLAQLELFRLVVDGLNLGALEALAVRLSVPLPALKEGERRATMNTLKLLLPPALLPTVHIPLKACSTERNKVHGVPRKPAHAFAAFREFHNHLMAVHHAIRSLRLWLEQEVHLSAEKCLRREEIMNRFPRIDGPLRPASKAGDFRRATGKTIARVEAGEFIPGKGCHRREVVTFHFTDGTAMSIDVGSNAANLESDFSGLDASMFHADLMPMWAPAPEA